MSRRDNVVSTYLSDEEKSELSRFVSEVDESQATVVRKALMEYLDFDRYDRIESQLRENTDKLERVLSLLDDGQHTHTSGQTKASDTVEKARAIAKRLYGNHDFPMKESGIERAIEDIAGADDRTLSKYKDILKSRGLLYAHPSTSPVWTDDRREWVGWVEDYVEATPDAEFDEFAENHGVDIDEYERLAAQVQL